MNIEEKINLFLQEQTTTANVAQYKKKIGSKQETNNSIVVNITSEDKEKELVFLKKLTKEYQDRGVVLNTQLDNNYSSVELVSPCHLVDEIKGKLEKRKNLEIIS